MKKELRGKVKRKLWVRPICTDDSERVELGQKARADFKLEAKADEGDIDVAAPDILGEAQELGDEPIDPEPEAA